MLIFGKYLLLVILGILLLCVISYMLVPVYKLSHGAPFSGDRIYNPYAQTDSTAWRKANFHCHQKEKPQCNYTVDQMLDAYYQNGYDIASISDHQCINYEHAERPGFIPTYEHGYGVNGYHQLVMGAGKVSWREFPLMITQSQMQYMLAWLRPQSKALVLNHPGKTKLIDLSIYGWLRGYDLLEINPEQGRQRSDQHWDTALSAGIYSTLIGDDDAHSITNRESWFQRCFTRVNTPTLDPDDIIAALKRGAAYAVVVPHTLNRQKNPHANLPSLQSISFEQDTIHIRLDRPATIRFIGQNGTLLAESVGSEAEYRFADADTYVRCEARFDNGVILYFNPFVRTQDGARPANIFTPVINYPLTILSHILWLVLCFGLVAAMFRVAGVSKGRLFYRWHPRIVLRPKTPKYPDNNYQPPKPRYAL